MTLMQTRREGFALAGAVLAMVLVGAIVTGGFYAAHQESRITRSTELGDLAQYIAEQGLETVTANTKGSTLDAIAMNGHNTIANNVSVQYGGRTVGNYTVVITRMTEYLFVVRSTGTVTIAQAGNASNSTRTLSQVIRRRVADFDNQTAVQVYGDLTVTGNSNIIGADMSLAAWSGCTLTANTDAVTANPTSTIQIQGAGTIAGTTDQSTQLSANDFTVFGDITWQELVSMATNVVPANTTISQIMPTTSNGQCRTSDLYNWGAPTSPLHVCFNYFPIIYVPGDLTISANGTGQGILLIAGNMNVQSQFDFYGPVVVLGTVDTQGGAKVVGSLFAYGGGTVGDAFAAGNMTVQYSSCGIKRAALGAFALSRGIPIRNRSWMDYSAVRNSF